MFDLNRQAASMLACAGFLNFFGKSDFSLYGTWEGVVVGKILPQGVGTISTPGKLNSEKFKI